MTTLLLRGFAAFRSTPAPNAGRSRAPNALGDRWLTPAIRSNMSARARRLMRSGD